MNMHYPKLLAAVAAIAVVCALVAPDALAALPGLQALFSDAGFNTTLLGLATLTPAIVERKSGGDGGGADLGEIKRLVESQGHAWEEFKRTNDERIAKLAKGESVADLEAKLATLNAEFKAISDEVKALEIKAQRDVLAGGQGNLELQLKSFNKALIAQAMRLSRPIPAPMDAEGYVAYKQALETILRKGRDELSDVQRKAVNVGTDPDGGYLLPFEMESTIDRVATKASAMRQIARVQTIGAGSYKKVVTTSGAAAGGWAGETTSPAETATPGMVELEFVPGTVWAEPRATSQALEDLVFDVEAWLAEEVGITFADQESQAFIDGNGVNRPRGFLAYDIVANASYAWGKLGYTKTGGAAAFAASNPSDALVDLQHSLKRTYRANAAWVMNDATLGVIRKFKDGQGIYLWAPSGLEGGIVGQLLGHPVVTDDYMPDLGANAYPAAFGDFRRGYMIVDRRGISVLRDPYTAKPYVKYYTTKRVGGGVQNFEAIKLLKCEA